MKSLHTRFFSGFLLLLLSSCGPQNNSADNANAHLDTEEWQMLFNGQNTDGWRSTRSDTLPGKSWKAEDGVLTGSGEGGDIISVGQYGNFELEWEWKMLTKGGNSGIKYFVREYPSENGKTQWLGLEYQILDDENFSWMHDGRMKPGDFRTLASLYEIYPAEKKISKPVGEWNTSRIVSKGDHCEHWLNGAMVLQFERGSEDFRSRVAQSKFASYENFGEGQMGRIMIQDHGSVMNFRNIRIRELAANP